MWQWLPIPFHEETHAVNSGHFMPFDGYLLEFSRMSVKRWRQWMFSLSLFFFDDFPINLSDLTENVILFATGMQFAFESQLTCRCSNVIQSENPLHSLPLFVFSWRHSLLIQWHEIINKRGNVIENTAQDPGSESHTVSDSRDSITDSNQSSHL